MKATFVFVYALMDLNKTAVWVEAVKCGTGLYWIWSTGDWFGLNGYFEMGSLFVGAYLLFSFLTVIGFSVWEIKRRENLSY